MPLVQTRGAASAQGFGEFAQAATAINYIEDVFSCFLYTGTGATQTITNNIDLSTKGGLTWIKGRSGATGHRLTDTARGATKSLESNSTAAEVTESTGLTAFGTTGFTIGADADYNTSAATYASWTFRKQPKLFDIQTWTGNDATSRTLSHSINGTVGCVMVKKTSSTGNWIVWHRTFLTAGDYIILNSTAEKQNDVDNGITTTSSTFDIKYGLNVSGETYVAYLFAHNAGGFGLTGTDNVISCGSYTGNGSATGPFVNLGFEPQWLLVKMSSSAGYYWQLVDNMRGISTGGNDAILNPNVSDAEYSFQEFDLASTGFYPMGAGSNSNVSGETYIYIAIRRGPMKVPTDATKVFAPVAYTGTNVDNRLVNTGILTDMTMARIRATTSAGGFYTADRLRGNASLGTAITDVENTDADSFMTPTVGYGGPFSAMNGFGVGNDVTRQLNQSSTSQLAYAFQRAPSFFDEVCYTGNGTAGTTQTHNLGAVPEMMIVKDRNYSGGRPWPVYHSSMGNTQFMYLNATDASATNPWWNNTTPTASVFTIGSNSVVNFSGTNYVAYLFATCAGVSKCFSYTGNGSSQTINCGFITGARWIMIKRTDSTGDWYVWDTARGIIAGNDPHLSLNTTAVEVTSNDTIDTDSTGFVVNQVAATNVNVSSATYIGVAIA
jgi:hypothetical protein